MVCCEGLSELIHQFIVERLKGIRNLLCFSFYLKKKQQHQIEQFNKIIFVLLFEQITNNRQAIKLHNSSILNISISFSTFVVAFKSCKGNIKQQQHKKKKQIYKRTTQRIPSGIIKKEAI